MRVFVTCIFEIFQVGTFNIKILFLSIYFYKIELYEKWQGGDIYRLLFTFPSAEFCKFSIKFQKKKGVEFKTLKNTCLELWKMYIFFSMWPYLKLGCMIHFCLPHPSIFMVIILTLAIFLLHNICSGLSGQDL